jgi:hypothetical protein
VNPAKSTLSVYNLGIKVCDMPAHQCGTGGVVVSKRRLELNTARNAVLMGKCAVFKEVRKLLEKYAEQATKKTGVTTEPEREFLARKLVGRDMDLSEAMKHKLVTDCKGRHWPLSKLNDYRGFSFAVAPTDGHPIAEALHMRKVVFVLSPQTLARFGAENGEDLVSIFHAMTYHGHAYDPQIKNHHPFSRLEHRHFEDFAGMFEGNLVPLTDRELTPKERLIARALNAGQRAVSRAFNAVGQERVARSIRVGASDTAQAWTDGADVIFLRREVLAHADQGLAGMTAIAALLVHEYVHDCSDQASHRHGPEFYEVYEAVVANPDVNLVGRLTADMLQAYVRLLRTEEKKMPRGVAATEDVAHELDRLWREAA